MKTTKIAIQKWMPQAAPYLIMAVAPLCWAGNAVLAGGVVDMIPPVTLAFFRWAAAFVILLPFTWNRAKQDWPAALKAWKILTLISIFGISCFNSMLYKAVHTIPVINVTLIQTAMPAFIILISLILYREKITGLQVLGMILCLSGAGLVVLKGNITALFNMSFLQGDILMIAAVILYAFYSVLLRKRPNMHPLSFLTYTFGIGAFWLSPVYAWETIHCEPFDVTWAVVSSVLYVAVFPSIVAYFCWNRGIEVLGPSRGGLFINLMPVFASVLAIIWLDESLMAFHVYGMALILTGMMLFNRKPVSNRDKCLDTPRRH